MKEAKLMERLSFPRTRAIMPQTPTPALQVHSPSVQITEYPKNETLLTASLQPRLASL